MISVEGVANSGGNVDLIPTNGITIVANDTANTITFGLPVPSGTASNQVMTWNGTTWVAAPPQAQPDLDQYIKKVEGVSPNPINGGVDLIGGLGIKITPNNAAHTIEFENTLRIEGVSPNPVNGGIDLVPGAGIKITPDNENHTITFEAPAHKLEGVSPNVNGNIDLIPGSGMQIVPNTANNSIGIKLVDGAPGGAPQMLKWNGTSWVASAAGVLAIETANGIAIPVAGVLEVVTANGLAVSADDNLLRIALPPATNAGETLVWNGTQYVPTKTRHTDTITGDGTKMEFTIVHNLGVSVPNVTFMHNFKSVEIDWDSVDVNSFTVKPGVPLFAGVTIGVVAIR